MKKIDDIVKNELENSGLPFKEEYWNDMEFLLDQKKKKPMAVYFTLAALVLIIGISAVVYVNSNQDNQIQENPVSISSTAPNTSKNPSIESIQTENNTSEESNDQIQSKTIETSSITENTKSNYTPNKNQVFLTPNAKEIETPKIENNSVSTKNIAQSNETQVENYIDPVINTPQPDVKPIEDEEIVRASILQFPYFSINTIDSFSFYVLEVQKHMSNSFKNPIQPKQKWAFALTPYIGFNMFSNTKSYSDINALKSEEKLLKTKSYGINIIARKNRIAFSTGIGFNQFSIQSNYSSIGKSYTFDTSYKLVNSFYGITSNGTRIALIKQIIDTTTLSYSEVKNPNKKSTFSYLQIPLTVRYTIPIKGFDFFVEPGLNSQFLIKSKGLYVASQNNVFNVKNADDKSDLNQVLLGGSMHVGMQFRINKRISLTSSYGYMQTFNSMYKSYQQKQSNTQFKIGLEFGL